MVRSKVKRPTRFVLATPICDGHDVAACAITRLLRREGVEAVYIGFNKTPQQIVKAAVEEDATAIALSTYNGGHMIFLRDILAEQKRQGIGHIPLFCGGGGTILASEVKPLEKAGVAKVYRPPMDLAEACRDMIRRAEAENRRASKPEKGNGISALSRQLTLAELEGGKAKTNGASKNGSGKNGTHAHTAPVWGIGGRGGAGKSTLVDEFLFRFLHRTKGKIAVVAIDPTLGDRLRMLHCYDERVFLRSVTLGPGDSLDKKLPSILSLLVRGPFDLILVESVGLGQNDLGVAPFVEGSIYCMTPEYGSDVQLEKEVLLRRADIVVMNKRDYPQAEVRARRVKNFIGENQKFILTEAKDHGDEGVTQLFEEVCARAGIAISAEAKITGTTASELHAATTPRGGYMGQIVESHENYYGEMKKEIEATRKDPARAKAWLKRFADLWSERGFDGDRTGAIEREGVLLRKDAKGSENPVARLTTCGLWVPVLGLPPRDSDVSQIIAYFYKQNTPGAFPFTEGAFTYRRADQDPIRMFAGLGLPETTNARFHLLSKRGGVPRLSTAFDSLTLYGIDSDEPGALAKVGEGGVAVDTVEDMKRLYAGFNLEEGSVSLTMSGPAPMILAMFLAAARQRGFDLKKLRGTIQTDILKEIQAQNEAVFPLEPSMRLIADMIEWTMREAPLWYPISISGYHIGEAGANPIQEMAFTLANGFTYVEALKRRGLPLNEFAKRFSFFFTSGSEMEFNVLGRVARRIWAVGMEKHYGVKGAGARLKFHSQTSGRALQDVEPLHNLARVTIQAEYALNNNTNSLHTNSYKETYSTPEEDDVILAMGCQQIPLLETGAYRFTENLHQGAYGLSYLEDEVERAVHRIFREIDQLGGVIPAIENEYHRTVIQEEVQREQKARRNGERTIVGVNYMNFGDKERPRGALVHIPMADKKKQIARTQAFKKKHAKRAEAALKRLQEVAAGDGNVFAEMMNAAEVCSVGQMTHALWGTWGRFRATM